MRLLTAPAAEPVSLDQAKFAARLTGITAFDAMLPIYIQAAREIAEMETGVRWMAQEWRSEFADWPTTADVVPLAGATAVAVSYVDEAGTWQDLDDADVVWADMRPGVAIAPPVDAQFPKLGQVAIGPRVRVDVTVGAASAATVPSAIKTFIMGMVAYWVENPQAYTDKPHIATPAMLRLLDSQREAY